MNTTTKAPSTDRIPARAWALGWLLVVIAGATTALAAHTDGGFIAAWTQFGQPSSVYVDAEDNIWAVDEGTDTIVKFSPAGKVLMTIGRRWDPVEMLGNMPGSGAFHGLVRLCQSCSSRLCGALQCGHRVRTRRWAMTPSRVALSR